VNAQIQVVLIAASCTSGVGLIGMGVIWLLRRASLRLLLQVSGAVIVLAVVAGTLGTAQAMFLSPHDLRVVVMVCVVAAAVAAGFGALLGRQLQASSLALRQAARSLGDEDGGYRSPAGPMTAELAALSRELAETSKKLKESRGREHALERSRRELVTWVSHDLRTPLAGLHAMAEALEDGIAAEPARYHRQIRAEVARLARMVDDLFELSCAQAGTLRLSPGRIALEDLVNDALASTEALARARGVRLTGTADAPLEVRHARTGRRAAGGGRQLRWHPRSRPGLRVRPGLARHPRSRPRPGQRRGPGSRDRPRHRGGAPGAGERRQHRSGLPFRGAAAGAGRAA
jgi:signal transduction histidine kinase